MVAVLYDHYLELGTTLHVRAEADGASPARAACRQKRVQVVASYGAPERTTKIDNSFIAKVNWRLKRF